MKINKVILCEKHVFSLLQPVCVCSRTSLWLEYISLALGQLPYAAIISYSMELISDLFCISAHHTRQLTLESFCGLGTT